MKTFQDNPVLMVLFSPAQLKGERSWSEKSQCAATHILLTNQLFFVGLTAGVSKAEWFMSGHRKKPLGM